MTRSWALSQGEPQQGAESLVVWNFKTERGEQLERRAEMPRAFTEVLGVQCWWELVSGVQVHGQTLAWPPRWVVGPLTSRELEGGQGRGLRVAC